MGSGRMTKELFYINLTNGIEVIQYLPIGYRFIRIQSTLCERKCWDKLLLDLDYDFLMNLALGNRCVIFDYSPKKKQTRAIYQGLEFIKYILTRRWFRKAPKAFVKGMNVTAYFEQEYEKFSKAAKAKIDYFEKFLQTDELRVEGICARTGHDNDFSFYCSVLAEQKKILDKAD